MTYCCPIDLEKIIRTKELCDWQDLKVDAYESFTVKERLWRHGEGATLPTWGTPGCGTDEADACIDNERTCFYVSVVDQNDNPIEGYTITIDGTTQGVTDEDGILKFQLDNTYTIRAHTLNLCYCFSTLGNCNQIRFDITVNVECPIIPCDDPPVYFCPPPEGTVCSSGCTLPLNSVYIRLDPADSRYGQVIYNVSAPILTFAVGVTGAVCTGAGPGGDALAAGFTIAFNPATCGYTGIGAIPGDTIPAGCGVLLTLLLDATPVPTGMSGLSFTTTAGVVIPMTVITDCL